MRAMLAPAADSVDLARVIAHFHAHGWARLGPVAAPETVAALAARTDDLMHGRVTCAGLFFQHDAATGRYDDLEFGRGWVGPSPAYRKLEKLERDPLFAAWIGNPLFERVARAVIAPPEDIALYRAVLWNKRAEGGMAVPWHQDGGRFWGVDRAPILQLWTALDDAPVDAGCVEVIDASHLGGLATAEGGTIPDALTAPIAATALPLPARAGEVLLIHNLVWHRSQRNHTAAPRRALSICYMSAATRCLRTRRAPRQFVRPFARP
jgi:hypothetical protein